MITPTIANDLAHNPERNEHDLVAHTAHRTFVFPLNPLWMRRNCSGEFVEYPSRQLRMDRWFQFRSPPHRRIARWVVRRKRRRRSAAVNDGSFAVARIISKEMSHEMQNCDHRDRRRAVGAGAIS